MIYPTLVVIRAAVATVGFAAFSHVFKKLGIDAGIIVTPGNVVRAFLPALCTVTLIELTTK